MPGYESPAAAFSNTLEERMLQREAKRRQDLLDQHKIRMDEADLELQQNTLDERRKDRERDDKAREEARKEALKTSAAAAEDKIKTAKQTRYEKRVAGKVPGDVFTPDMAQDAIDTGNADDFAPPQPQQFTDEAGAVTTGTVPMGGVMQDTPTPQDYVKNKIALRYMGSPVQRATADKDAKVKDITDRLKGLNPNSDEYRKTLVEYDMATGKSISAGFVPKPETPGAITDASYALPGVGPIVGQRNKQGRIIYQGKDVTDLVKPYAPPQQAPQPIIFQSGEGPMLVDRGKNTAKPVMGPDGKPLTAQTTAATRTMMEGAQMLEPHIAEVGGLADELEKAGLFGPLSSRMRHLAEKAGSLDEFMRSVYTDPELQKDPLVGKFSTELALLVSGSARVHYGGRAGSSPGAIKGFKDMLSDASTAAMFKGRLSGLDSYMGGYAEGPPGGSGGRGKTTEKPKTKVFTAGPYKGKTGTLNAKGTYDVEE